MSTLGQPPASEPASAARSVGRANRVELSPLSFLEHAAFAFGDRVALVDGVRRFSYRDLRGRVHRLASGLRAAGVRPGDRVAILAFNGPALLESHYGVPLMGGILVPINARLSTSEVRSILCHSGARALLVDDELAPVAAPACADSPDVQLIVRIADAGEAGADVFRGAVTYADLLAGGQDEAGPAPLRDENEPICILYTSGTTGQPKGVVYTHRGAYLNALAVALEARLATDSVYLWVLPMFHCSGWCFTWGVTAVGARHVSLRKVEPARVWELIEQEGVSHFCAAPTVLIALANDPAARRQARPVRVATGGAPPSPTTITQMAALGVEVTHLYGMTETYGPSLVCSWWPEWDGLTADERARLAARQGVPHVNVAGARVVDAAMRDVPADGQTMGELVIRGNTVMAGYYRDPAATEAAFSGGWLHTGDLGVLHPNGYVELRDRGKDVIISGGENISTIELEQVLLRHPAVLEAAVVGVPDDQWGEVPKAFVSLKPGQQVGTEELIGFCREQLARFKAPRSVVFGELPKTSTGKIQKYVLREREWQGRARRIN